MCFSFVGRIQTRLLSLIGPLLLLAAVSVAWADWGPLRMFALMGLLALALDAGLYRWLIDYQPRWLTIVLGGVEFLLLIGVMHTLVWRPFVWTPLDFYLVPAQAWRADVTAALTLYLPSWSLAWLTTHVVLPWIWPRWTEDSGELRRI
jgi:hypothetical protein